VAYCVLELIENGELFDYVAQGMFKPKVIRHYFRQMLAALNYLQSKGLSHRDLKPENCMLDANYNLKIMDFGFAAPTHGRDGSGKLSTNLGTPGYMAPEILEGQQYMGPSVDTFAFGVIMFILYAGYPPFSDAVRTDRHYKYIKNEQWDMFWMAHHKDKPEGFWDPEFMSLLTYMMNHDVSMRLPMADLAAHPWVTRDDCPSAAELQADMGERHANIKQDQEDQIKQKQAIKVSK
jgi:serine/threonine protein kinase